MTPDVYESIVQVEHDHTALEVLLEDLAMIAQQAFAATDETLLADARTTWEWLRKDIASHFRFEEKAFFCRLEEAYPELRARLEPLRAQHHVMNRILDDLGALLEGPCDDMSARQASFRPRWDELWLLWRDHSRNEWELISELRTWLREHAVLDAPGLTPIL